MTYSIFDKAIACTKLEGATILGNVKA